VSAPGPLLAQPIMISAVIPTYNRSHLVARAVQSVLEQSFPPAEVIVVDDGSTDATEDSLRQFGAAVQYVRQENSGGATARNRGVRESTREWVAFLDSDDMWATTHLERIAEAIIATKGGAAVYFDDMAIAGRAELTWWEAGGFQISGTYMLVPDGTDWVLREYQPMMLQSSVCNRRVFLEEGGLWGELRNAHDTHFFLKVGIGHAVCAVRGIGSILTADASSLSRLTWSGMDERRYLNKTQAFRDILVTKPQLTESQRDCLRERIAASFWAVGSIAWKEHHFGRFLLRIIQALLAEPRATARLFTGFCRSRGSGTARTPSSSEATH
jgi:glycosyltransferase involved in cell wall biosynthesis